GVNSFRGFSAIGPPPSPNARVHPPGPLQRRGVARKQNAASVVAQRLVRFETLNVPDARGPFVRIISMSGIEFRPFFFRRCPHFCGCWIVCWAPEEKRIALIRLVTARNRPTISRGSL